MRLWACCGTASAVGFRIGKTASKDFADAETYHRDSRCRVGIVSYETAITSPDTCALE